MIENLFIYLKNGWVVIFEFYEQKYLKRVHLKFNLAQSTKQEIRIST